MQWHADFEISKKVAHATIKMNLYLPQKHQLFEVLLRYFTMRNRHTPVSFCNWILHNFLKYFSATSLCATGIPQYYFATELIDEKNS